VKAYFARLAIALISLTGTLSQRMRTEIAAVLSDVFWFVAWPRRRVTLTNLRLCFPDKTDKERRRMGRQAFRNIVRAALDHSVLWTADRQTIESYVKVEGAEHVLNPANRPLIMVAPHFLGLDAGGVRVNTLVRGCSIYSRQKNPVWEAWLLKARRRFNEPVLMPRQGLNMRELIRTVKKDLPLYYLPDVDLGLTNSIFVPFFGVNAATIPMVSRLARLTGARVVMAVTEMTRHGYVLHVDPPWPDFPGASIEEDTARMNREIERWIGRLPEQYLWSHKRFKTRPPGEPSVY
jgi:KDO2-lipid IV(A) lauroyltransferase